MKYLLLTFSLFMAASFSLASELEIIDVEQKYPEFYQEAYKDQKKVKKSSWLKRVLKKASFKNYSCYVGVEELDMHASRDRAGWVYASTLKKAKEKAIYRCSSHYEKSYDINTSFEICEDLIKRDQIQCGREWLELLRFEF